MPASIGQVGRESIDLCHEIKLIAIHKVNSIFAVQTISTPYDLQKAPDNIRLRSRTITTSFSNSAHLKWVFAQRLNHIRFRKKFGQFSWSCLVLSGDMCKPTARQFGRVEMLRPQFDSGKHPWWRIVPCLYQRVVLHQSPPFQISGAPDSSLVEVRIDLGFGHDEKREASRIRHSLEPLLRYVFPFETSRSYLAQ